MYAIALLRYRRPLAEVLTAQERHRAYLRELHERGTLLASGPLEPRTGGALLLHVPDGDALAALERVRDGDPFTREGMAEYELLRWAPILGMEELGKLHPAQLIFLEEGLVLSKKRYRDRREIESEYPDYKASIGPLSQAELNEYFRSDHGEEDAAWPFTRAAIARFFDSDQQTILSPARE